MNLVSFELLTFSQTSFPVTPQLFFGFRRFGSLQQDSGNLFGSVISSCTQALCCQSAGEAPPQHCNYGKNT